METIENRWHRIRQIIGTKDVTVIAISKKQLFSTIHHAYDLGIRHFGENYVQEALPKIQESAERELKIQWHYVGALQTNKMNKIVPNVEYVHAIDSDSQIEKLKKMQESGMVIPKLLVQLNVANEDTKSGLHEAEIKPFLEKVSQCTQLEISGLMTFPPMQADPEKSRPYFARTNEWKEIINGWRLDRIQIKDLSMGVSNDYQVAIEEGATMIRLGEAIFGPRDKV